jgi:hypothetical protein
MGIDLLWEDENGNAIGELGDPGSLVERFLPGLDAEDFPCLRFVDRYGDTVFNQAQIDQVIIELERLARKWREPKVEQHLKAVLDFVAKARNQVHTYIKFYGD